MRASRGESLSTIGLFAGIGGIERGFELAGHETELLCEIDAGARKVLGRRFSAKVEPDIRRMGAFPDVDLIAAGFPCQDLSQAGMTAGIAGKQSKLVGEVFKRLRDRKKGTAVARAGERAVHAATPARQSDALLGRRARGSRLHLGVQSDRRARVRRTAATTSSSSRRIPHRGSQTGAFWLRRWRESPVVLAGQTVRLLLDEGLRGLGWAVDAVPTLKGGSTIGIPSPPAIRDSARRLDHDARHPRRRTAARLRPWLDCSRSQRTRTCAAATGGSSLATQSVWAWRHGSVSA